MRWLPYPVLSAFVLAMWLLLNQSAAAGHLLLGSALALAGGWMMALLEPPRPGPFRLGAIARLAGRVLFDILRSNLGVGRIVLGVRSGRRTSGFVRIPLELRNPYGLATLACIITAAPGTTWVGFDSDRGLLLIHVLDLIDEQAWVSIVKQRYERLLLEIFP